MQLFNIEGICLFRIFSIQYKSLRCPIFKNCSLATQKHFLYYIIFNFYLYYKFIYIINVYYKSILVIEHLTV